MYCAFLLSDVVLDYKPPSPAPSCIIFWDVGAALKHVLYLIVYLWCNVWDDLVFGQLLRQDLFDGDSLRSAFL